MPDLTTRAARGVALVLVAVVLPLGGCGDDDPATLEIDTADATEVVARAAEFAKDCYRDGSSPETCTSATVSGLFDFCADLVGSSELDASDGAAAVTVYPAGNELTAELSCLFNNPRSGLTIEMWRDPPDSLCDPVLGRPGQCLEIGDGYEAGRPDGLPAISVAAPDGRVVATTASPTLDDEELRKVATELARIVLGVEVSLDALAQPAAQPDSTNPE